MTVRNARLKRKALSLSFLVRYSLNTGMKQAEMALAKTASKNTLGMRLAV